MGKNNEKAMTLKERIEVNGYKDVAGVDNPKYEDRFLGVSHDDRAVFLSGDEEGNPDAIYVNSLGGYDNLLEKGYEGIIVFDSPSFKSALIGVTNDRRAVYDLDKMVESLVTEDNVSEEEAIDFIEYNTLRAIPYEGIHAPIVMFTLDV